ncbi:MAG: serine hydrolase domain-containing protein [Actinomycetes bacterium]
MNTKADQLKVFIEDLMKYWPLPGGTVVITNKNEIVSEFAFGYADIERAIPTRTDHLYEIGSISKTFVSIIINQLVVEGRIDLDQEITSILPWVQITGDAPAVTVRNLLAHTAGLIMGGDGIPDDFAQIWALRNSPRVENTQTHFHYSNVGFMLLGLAIEALTKSSLADQLKVRIFEPLGMDSSVGAILHEHRDSMAVGYWPMREELPWRPGDAQSRATWFEVFPADGCVASTSTDMAKFLFLLLNQGSVAGKKILPITNFKEMATPHAPDGEDMIEIRGGYQITQNHYGLGVNTELVNGKQCLSHGGGMVGYSSFALVDTESNFGVTVLTNANGDYPAAHLIARAAHQLFVPSSDTFIPLPPAELCIVNGISSPTPEMLGIFTSSSGEITLSNDGETGIRIVTRGHTGSLQPTWTGRYVCDLPVLETFRWDFLNDARGARWVCGPDIYYAGATKVSEPGSSNHPLVGHYRNYSPWFNNFRIIQREGQLFLVAPGGVEAPQFDLTLVAVGDNTWRIGEEAWLPEILVAGPEVNGAVISVFRDGVQYSRTPKN